MAKSEQLENILDELSLLKEREQARDQRLGNIENSLKQLLQIVNQAPSKNQKHDDSPKNVIPYDTLKDAVYDGISGYYKDEPDHTGVLSEANIKKIHDVIYKVENEILQPHWAKEKEAQEQKEQKYNEQRRLQGIESVHQVNEWAPDYPPEIQRTIRYLGLRILPDDEPVESAHQNLRIWGDALMQITNRATPTPSLKAWLLYKWRQFKALFKNRRGIAYLMMYFLGIATITCIALYQSAVMDLDRTNRIFYRNVIKNEKRSKDYHELDSLIHSNSFFKTYQTLDE